MGRIGDEIVVARVRHMDADRGARPRDPVQLFHHIQEDFGGLAQMFEHVVEQNLFGGVIVEGPRELFQIVDHVGREV